ncbi:MAG: flavin reductase family protein [Cellulosilyticaceae bacterium]
MSKQKWKSGNMVYPLPAIMVSCGTKDAPNIVTVAWTGTICTNPAMTYISLRKSRYSYDLIKEAGYFVLNLTTRDLAYATDFCGVRSGKDYNKFEEMKLTLLVDEESGCPMIGESPVNVVCRVTEIKELGSHDMFLAEVENIYADEEFIDDAGKFHLNQSDLVAYSHGEYFELGKSIGRFGYSVTKPKTEKKVKNRRRNEVVTPNNKSKSKTKTNKKIKTNKK